jgi:hypothetical protein
MPKLPVEPTLMAWDRHTGQVWVPVPEVSILRESKA